LRRETERRLLQAALALGCLSPLWFGLRGAIEGPAMLAGIDPGQAPPDMLSHYRYLSGLFAGLGLVLLSCRPRIEARSGRFRLACGVILLGGFARGLGLIWDDAPSRDHLIALAVELGVVPLLFLWQTRVARRFA
jgi:hypothetical protein